MPEDFSRLWSMDPTWKLQIEREIQDSVLVLTVTGRLGISASGQLIETLLAATRDGRWQIVVNLEGVDYMSSAGLRALADASRRVHDGGGKVVLCAVGEPVRLVLEMAGLLGELAVEPTLEAGLEHIRRSSAGN